MTKFEKGKSGNPGGRPKGVKDKRAIFREMVEDNRELLLGKAMEMAKDGNEAMLKLLLDRLLPARPKDNPLTTHLNFEGSFGERTKTILDGVSNGELTCSQAKDLSSVLNVCEMAKKLEDIEQRLNQITAGME